VFGNDPEAGGGGYARHPLTDYLERGAKRACASAVDTDLPATKLRVGFDQPSPVEPVAPAGVFGVRSAAGPQFAAAAIDRDRARGVPRGAQLCDDPPVFGSV